MHCRHVVPGRHLLHLAVRLLPLHGRQRHGDLQQYQQVRAVEFLCFKIDTFGKPPKDFLQSKIGMLVHQWKYLKAKAATFPKSRMSK